jgi:hypothetical protein
MANGFCEGCPVPRILDQVVAGDVNICDSKFLKDEKTRQSVADLAIAIASQVECIDGPEHDMFDEVKTVEACQHPYVMEISQIGDVVSASECLTVVIS